MIYAAVHQIGETERGARMDNIIIQMFQKKFFLMFIPKRDVFSAKMYDKRIIIGRPESLDYYTGTVRKNKIVVFENALGSFVFSNSHTFDVFQKLQRKHKDCVSYVFCADGDFGYFKILEQGKISRKITSLGYVDGITITPETRGVPCQFEAEKNRVFKIDGKTVFMADMLKDFGQREVEELLDYYIGFNSIADSEIEIVNVYTLNESVW